MFYTRGAINMALALPANPPFDKEVLIDTAGKEGEGGVYPYGNKEDEDLQLEGQGCCGSNQTKTKVRALFLEHYATMPYTTVFVLARGPLKLGDVLHKKLSGIGTLVDITSPLLFVLAVAVIRSKYLITISHSYLLLFLSSYSRGARQKWIAGSFFHMVTRRIRICSSRVKVVPETTKPRPRYVQCFSSFTPPPCGGLQALKCPPQEVARDQHPSFWRDFAPPLMFVLAAAVILS
jgi:hypothetical protein